MMWHNTLRELWHVAFISFTYIFYCITVRFIVIPNDIQLTTYVYSNFGFISMYSLADLLQAQAFHIISIFHKLGVQITVIMKTDLEMVRRLVYYYGYVWIWKILLTVVVMGVVIPPMPPVCNASWGKVLIGTWFLPQRGTTCYSNFADLHYRHLSLNNFGNPDMTPVSFGFPTQITDNCLFQNCHKA